MVQSLVDHYEVLSEKQKYIPQYNIDIILPQGIHQRDKCE